MKKVCRVLAGAVCLISAVGVLADEGAIGPQPSPSLIDFFLPAEPVGKLEKKGIWGDENVLPRDVRNGLEDPKVENWCYWDGMIVKAEDGKYYMYASRWDQSLHHHVCQSLGSVFASS